MSSAWFVLNLVKKTLQFWKSNTKIEKTIHAYKLSTCHHINSKYQTWTFRRLGLSSVHMGNFDKNTCMSNIYVFWSYAADSNIFKRWHVHLHYFLMCTNWREMPSFIIRIDRSAKCRTINRLTHYFPHLTNQNPGENDKQGNISGITK